MATTPSAPATRPDGLSGVEFRAWIERSALLLGQAREGLNSENVYPVADGDTGTNVWATVEAGRAALGKAGEAPALFAQGALLGARGNSGVITSQIFAGIAAGLEAGLVAAFEAARKRAWDAVAKPLPGTILTAMTSATEFAQRCEEGSAREIARAAWSGAHRAVIDSALNPPIPEAAGVIDAGAHALERILAALVEVLDPAAAPLEGITFTPASVTACEGEPDGEYEVMYLLSAEEVHKVSKLRSDLEALGSSVLVVGDSPTWNVHVHTDDAGAAVDAGMKAGIVHRVRITTLIASAASGTRRVITVANGAGLQEVLEASGVTVIAAFESRRVGVDEWIDAAEGAHEVLLLPHDKAGKSTADEALIVIREDGARAAVLPSRSPVQTLAAIALHDESKSFDEVLGEMTEAVANAKFKSDRAETEPDFVRQAVVTRHAFLLVQTTLLRLQAAILRGADEDMKERIILKAISIWETRKIKRYRIGSDTGNI
ncbi:MAG: DAK2 domain-containing protein, partial [Actinobacteria bacterium]|nr:DAK2 domain-containing protein [Actinomycetota bacterium]